MLTKFDELTCRQVVSTSDSPQSTDRAWTEKMWFNLHDTRGEIIDKADGCIEQLSGALVEAGTDPTEGVPIERVEHEFS